MDLLTPARTWAAAEESSEIDEHEVHAPAMPPLQWLVMFVSLAGPPIGLLMAIYYLWHRGPLGVGWPEIVTIFVMYSLTGFGVTIGLHRLLTHRAFEAPRFVRLTLAILGSAAAQGMAIKWCATHRRHHQRSDRGGDPHSPHLHGDGAMATLRGLWHAHVGWCFDKDRPDIARSVPDLLADPGLQLVDRLYFLWVALGLLLPAVALGLIAHSWYGFVSGLMWGGLLRLVLMQHVTWSINSVCHVWGTRPFKSGDHSRNNFPVAILSLGEGWHNNHHAFPTSARHGMYWWQIDFSYMVITAMSWVGLARAVRVPSRAAMDAKSKG